MVDPRAIMQTTSHDPLGVAMRDMALAQLNYWEQRYRANPSHKPTADIRAACRATVRALENYYSLPRSFQNQSER